MKKIKINITSIITLVVGLLLGWLIFGGSDATNHDGHEHDAGETAENWTCSMHPQVQQDGPGKCPFCGMDLIPLNDDVSSGFAVLTMSENAVKLANIRTQAVQSGSASTRVRINGRIETDEGMVKSQVLHIPGRIEQLYVEYTGQRIQRGQKIATIYSPELVTAQKELREAAKLKDQYPELVAAARKKFENWKLSAEQIKQIESTTSIQTNFEIMADVSGIVTNKKVQVGDHVMQGGILFEVSDLSQVWAIFDVYEKDLNRIKMSDEIEFTVKALPGEQFSGKVEFIDPIVDPASRTASIRVSVRNSGDRLKPEMLAEGYITGTTDSNQGIMIPKSAVLWTGKRSLVYLQLKENEPNYHMQEVVLGNALDDHYVIKEGLKEGDLVVVNGVFSIDAATQLQGKRSMMNPDGGESPTGNDHARLPGGQGGMQMQDDSEGHSQQQESEHPEVNISGGIFEVSQTFKDQIRKVYDTYLPLKDALIETNANEAKQKANPLMTAINNVNMSLVKGDAHHEWMKDLRVLKASTQTILDQSDVEKIREALSPLSDQLYQTIIKFQVETGGYRQYCPMAFDFKGAFWLSDSEKVLNPYFGDEMLTCGNVEEELK